MTTSERADPASFRAVTTALDGSFDLDPFALAAATGILFANSQRTYAGLGVAAVLELPRGLDAPGDLSGAQQWLNAVPHTRTGHVEMAAVTAIGAFPFDRSAPARLIVPEVIVAAGADGRRWATLVGPARPLDPTAALERDPPTTERSRVLRQIACAARGRGDRGTGAHPAPQGRTGGGLATTVTARPDPAGFQAAVAEAVRTIRRGTLEKVVLARSLELLSTLPVRVEDVVGRLRDQEPASTVFSIPLASEPGDVVRFVGASPELLVRRRGESASSNPLAGTVSLGAPKASRGRAPDDREAGRESTIASVSVTERDAIERFLASPKEREEHRLVVDAIAEVLSAYCTEMTVPDAPSLVRLKTIAHMGTDIRGRLKQDVRHGVGPDRVPSVLELVAALHPTPAVGGVPRRLALECISALEPTGRGAWAGPVGWVDAGGDGDWVIGIRSGVVDGRSVRLSAGAGVVRASYPAAELFETTAKLTPVLEAFAPHLLEDSPPGALEGSLPGADLTPPADRAG